MILEVCDCKKSEKIVDKTFNLYHTFPIKKRKHIARKATAHGSFEICLFTNRNPGERDFVRVRLNYEHSVQHDWMSLDPNTFDPFREIIKEEK